jgi:hypothetical protein
MTPSNARRVPSILAGVLAMAASLTAMATVIWSDLAEASEPAQVMLADDVVAPKPVKLAKIEHKQVDEFEDEPVAKKPIKKKRRLDFGSFEGY